MGEEGELFPEGEREERFLDPVDHELDGDDPMLDIGYRILDLYSR